MPSAPLSQTLLITNDSLFARPSNAVEIPTGPVPAPEFTTAPTITPGSGTAGDTFTATNGVASNAISYTRRWLLGSTAIGTALTISPAAGALSLEVIAHGAGGDSAPVVIGPITVAAVTPTPTPTPTPSVSLSGAVSHSEGNTGTTAYLYTVTRSSIGTGAVNVPYTFSPGATSADDWAGGAYPSGGSCTIASGALTGTYSFFAQGDTTVEADETFSTAISAPAGYTLGSPSSATGTIVNDDMAIGPQPLTQSVLVDNNDGTYTVTPATWPTGTTVTNKTMRRDGVAITGLSGTSYTKVSADNGTFLDYAETGTLSGASTTVVSNRFALAVGLTNVFTLTTADPSADGTAFLTKFPQFAAKSVGDVSGVTSTASSVQSVPTFISGGSANGVLALDVGSLNWENSSNAGYHNLTVAWDIVDVNNYKYIVLENGNSFISFHQVVGGTDSQVGSAFNTGVAFTVPSIIKLTRAGTTMVLSYTGYAGYTFQNYGATPNSVIGLKLSTDYVAQQLWSLKAATAALAITSSSINVSGQLVINGTYQGSTPPTSFEMQLLGADGTLLQDFTAMTTNTLASGSLTATSTTAVARAYPSIYGKTAGVRLRAANLPTFVVPYLQAIPFYVAPRAAVFSANQALIQPYDTYRQYGNILRAGYYSNATTQDVYGNPTQSGHMRRFGHGDASGNALLLRWTSGDPGMTIGLGQTEGTVTYSSPTAPASRTLRFTEAWDYLGTGNGAHNFGSMTFYFNESDPPKGLTLTVEGEPANKLWSDAYIAFQQQFDATAPIRMMDAGQCLGTIGYANMPWSVRTQPGSLNIFSGSDDISTIVGNQYAFDGIPWEDRIGLANLANRDMHICLPCYATDDYYSRVFNMIATGAGITDTTHPGYGGLRAGRLCYVEYGNELWNFLFQFTTIGANTYCDRNSLPHPASGDGSAKLGYLLKEQAYQHNRIVGGLLGAVPNFATKFVRVLAQQNSGDSFHIDSFLAAGGSTAYVDAYATAPYFTVTTNSNDHTPASLSAAWLAAANAAMDKAATVKGLAANKLGARYITYEGGAEFAGTDLSGQEVLNFKRSAEYKAIVKTYLNRWKNDVGDCFQWYFDVGTNPYYAQTNYGLIEYQGQPLTAARGLSAMLEVIAGV